MFEEISETDNTRFFQMPSSTHLRAKTLKHSIFDRFPQNCSILNQGGSDVVTPYCTLKTQCSLFTFKTLIAAFCFISAFHLAPLAHHPHPHYSDYYPKELDEPHPYNHDTACHRPSQRQPPPLQPPRHSYHAKAVKSE